MFLTCFSFLKNGFSLASLLLNIALASSCPGPSQSARILIQTDLQNQLLLVYHGECNARELFIRFSIAS